MQATLENPQHIVHRLRTLQRTVRDMIARCGRNQNLSQVSRTSTADTIYKIDAEVDPLLEAFCEDWGRETPLVLVAEGIQNEHGEETALTFPRGADPQNALIRVIVDPIDGTRGIMYDKRAAWALAGVAPNLGDRTRLSDIQVAVMTELPTSKMGQADVLWAIRGHGAHGVRESLTDSDAPAQHLPLRPSHADTIAHGFATISNFFPGTKVLAAELMEHLAEKLIGRADVTRATVFEDQYISTGGQFYELIIGHDRFNADLRPAFYRMQNQPPGLCCHPYDCAALLIAQEARVIVTDESGRDLDGPLDTVSPISWIAYANPQLRAKIEPLVLQFLSGRET